MKKRIYKLAGVVIGLALTSVIIIGSFIIIEGKKTYTEEVDYLIVLGARLYGDVPSPSLLERLKVAHTYLEEHEDAKVVVSGGQGSNELVSEAYAMRKYLVDNGISEDRIILEDRSTSTFENLSYSLDKIRETDEREGLKILIASNSYHIFRSKLIAGRLGAEAYGLPAPIPQSVIIKSYAREYLAVIKSLIFDR
ncbi:MAG: YdcF family protein [Epulopiscium sp.]|nr:YdcF family protein [Candidatus Epulonipiscium sp.]